MFNQNPCERKHHGRAWSIRTQTLQILWDSIHIYTHALSNFYRPYERQKTICNNLKATASTLKQNLISFPACKICKKTNGQQIIWIWAPFLLLESTSKMNSLIGIFRWLTHGLVLAQVQIQPNNKFCFHLKYYNTTHDIPDLRRRREICSQLTIKTPELRHWRRSIVFILNLRQFSNLVLVLQLLTLNR